MTLKKANSFQGLLALATLFACLRVQGDEAATPITECVGRSEFTLPSDAEAALYPLDVVAKLAKPPAHLVEARFDDGQIAGYTQWSYHGGLYVTRQVTSAQSTELLRQFRELERVDRAYGARKKVDDTGMPLSFEELSSTTKSQVWRLGWGYSATWVLSDFIMQWSSTFGPGTAEPNAQAYRWLQHSVPRRPFEMPMGPGVCLPSLFIPDDGRMERFIASTYRLKQHPDVTVRVQDRDAEDDASASNQEVHVDALGRIRIRYEFQDADDQGAPASTWVRVQQPLAGNGTGMSFIPRIGHEVLVGFFDDDIERPYVMCSLYNGRGEGGAAVTPGGGDAQEVDASVFAQSSDASPGAQGNLSGGNSPAWHGGSAGELDQGGQRNAAALSGYKTKEFGGEGFNQLVFDDSTAQLRVQLATTQHATQLNLGHLIHQADNHRGSFRGVGFELRTDAYGAVRGGQGVLLFTYGASAADPAGDNAAGIALAKQWKTLATAFNGAVQTHQTVQLSGVIGAAKSGQSALDAKASPIAAWLTQASGMVSGKALAGAFTDAGNKSTAASAGSVPHGTDAVINVSARAGLAMVSGQDAAFVSNENVQFASGQDTDVAVGGAMRLHTGQAIGFLGGAIKAGGKAAGTGLTMIAGAGDIDVQAQAGTLQVAALNDLKIQSQSANIDWASAKRITLSTAGGASIVIEGGNVTVMCPGTITVHAATKSLVAGQKTDAVLPALPKAVCKDCLLNAMKQGAPGTLV